MTGGFHVCVPERGESDPLRDQRVDWVERQGGPAPYDRRSTKEEAWVTLHTTIPGELKAPVQGTKEGKENGTIGSLDVERLMQDSDSDARVDGRYDACDK